MSDDPIELRAEIARLRELLDDNGIDPDPVVWPAKPFGPPTLLDHMTHQAAVSAISSMLADWKRTDAIFASWGDKGGAPLRIRLPADFSVRS